MHMKKYFAILTAAALALASCQPQQPDGSKYAPAPKLPTSTGTVQFGDEGGSSYVGVTTEEAIEAESNRDWAVVTVDRYGFSVDAGKNTDIETRYAIISVKSGGLEASVQVVQFGSSTKYDWNDSYSFTYNGGTLSLLYRTEATVIVKINGGNWISAEPKDGVLTVTVEKNPYKEAREGSIDWQAGEDVRSFTISQAANPSGGTPGGDDPDEPTGNVLFSEDFENIDNLGDWSLFDADGDENTWTYGDGLASHSGIGILYSASYINGTGALTPDNWVITPAIKLSTDNYVSFWVAGQDPDWDSEHYGVYISTTEPQTGADLASFEKLFEATNPVDDPMEEEIIPYEATDGTSNITWQRIAVKIPDAYDNAPAYIAFRHFNCTDMFVLNLDDVMVTKGMPEKTVASASVSAARQPRNIVLSPDFKRK